MLCTGGGGFLGSRLCDRLIERGDDVLCVDNFYTGNKANVKHVGHARFELMRHDVPTLRVDGVAHRGAFADAEKAAGITDILPVGGPVDRAVEMARIDERFQQQQRITEAVQPITNQATLAQGQHAGGQIRVRWSGRITKRLLWRSG